MKLLLGNKLIHVRHLSIGELRTFKEMGKLPLGIIHNGAFRNTICSALSSFASEPLALGENERHEKCKILEMQSKYRHPDDLSEDHPQVLISEDLYRPMGESLTILSVCRQLYEESNFILWSTNTFSFDHPRSLLQFLATLNPAQKRNLKNLHLTVDSDYRLSWEWDHVLNSKRVSMLRGLETLQLCVIHTPYLQPYPFSTNADLFDHDYETPLKRALKSCSIETLRLLSVKSVAVAISDDCDLIDKDHTMLYRSLPSGLKATVAERVRQMILNPKGAELQHAADSAKRSRLRVDVARRAKSGARSQFATASRSIDHYKTSLAQAERHMAHTKDIASSAIAAAKDNPKMYTSEELKVLMTRAEKAEEYVTQKAASLEFWKTRLLQRMKSLEDATVRLANVRQAEGQSAPGSDSEDSSD